MILLPQSETVRLRGLQTYNAVVDSASPTSRVAFNLQKTRGEIARGNCLTVRGAPFSCEKQIVASIVPVRDELDPEEKPLIRNHSEVEVALGTGHQIAMLHFMDDRRFARLELREPIPALWNQPFLLIRHGGSAILGTGHVLWFGDVPREDRRRFAGLLGSLPEPIGGEEDRALLELRFFGMVKLPEGATPIRIREECTVVDRWAFHTPWLEKHSQTIKGLASRPAGISISELEGKLRIDGEALRRILAILTERNVVFTSNALYFAKNPGEKQELSALSRKLIAEIDRAGRTGFDSTKTGIEGAQKELKTLIRLGLIILLEGGLCYGKRAYEMIATEVLAGRVAGERFSIPDAKQRTSLSRKYMIPLLNRMEKDGLLRRDGDSRVVLETALPRAGSSIP